MVIDDFELFKSACKAATLKHFGSWRREGVKIEESLSNKGREVKRIFQNCDFECQTENVEELISAIIGEDISKDTVITFKDTESAYRPLPGVIFVFSVDFDGLKAGVAYMKSHEDRVINSSGVENSTGLPSEKLKIYYPPTEKEFEEFMDSLQEKKEYVDSDIPVSRIIDENSIQ